MRSPELTEAELRFKLAVTSLVLQGVYPGPVQIRRHLGREPGSMTINGRETQWRRELLTSFGWFERSHPAKRRHSFVPPLDWHGRLT